MNKIKLCYTITIIIIDSNIYDDNIYFSSVLISILLTDVYDELVWLSYGSCDGTLAVCTDASVTRPWSLIEIHSFNSVPLTWDTVPAICNLK